MRLKGETAVIGGAGAGIGRATAELLVRHGARVTIAEAAGRLSPLDIAGSGIRGNAVTTSEDEWSAFMAVNVTGVPCARHAMPHMVRQGGGAMTVDGGYTAW